MQGWLPVIKTVFLHYIRQSLEHHMSLLMAMMKIITKVSSIITSIRDALISFCMFSSQESAHGGPGVVCSSRRVGVYHPVGRSDPDQCARGG